MPMARRWFSLVAPLALLATRIACTSSRASSGRPSPREECRSSFAACAPPARFDEKTDVEKLTVRNLVHVAARLDVPDKLARKAANRLRKIVTAAQQPALLEIETAVDDTLTTLGKCGCGDRFRSELDTQGIAELVKRRLPSREVRSPEFWAERVFADLTAIRELKRSAATMMVTGDAAGGQAGAEASDAKVRDSRRKLCVTVHGARSALPPEAFAAVLDIVNRKEVSGAGEGSAAAALQMIAEYEAADTCGPAESR